MRPALLSALLVALLGACQHRPPAPPPPDGLYFVDAGTPTAPRLLLLKEGRFELREGDTWTGRGVFEARDGLLRLRPASGEGGAGLETTYAVVDGHLLVGVLRHVGGERRRWTSAALPEEFLGLAPPGRARPGAFRIDWDMEEGTWRFTSGERRVVLDGVARFEPPAHQGRYFLPVFRPSAEGGEASAAMGADRSDQVGMAWGVLYGFGLQASPEVPWEWDGPLVRLRSGTAASRYDARHLEPGRGRTMPGYYERRGDVVVTPWTVDLGPVGLLPVRKEPSSVEATYVSGREELVVSTKPPPPETSNGYLTEGLSSTVLASAGTCHYAPDARGLVVWTSTDVGHPPMNHWDKPFTLVCFALGDGRVVRYISSGGCSGTSPARLDVFQHRARP